MPKLSKVDEKLLLKFIEFNALSLNEKETLEIVYKKKITNTHTLLLIKWGTKNNTKSWGLLPYNIIIHDIDEKELLRVKVRERYLRLINLLFGKYICDSEPEHISSINEIHKIEEIKQRLFADQGNTHIWFDRNFVQNGLKVMGSTTSAYYFLKTCEIEIKLSLQTYINHARDVRLCVLTCDSKKINKKKDLIQENLFLLEQSNTGNILTLYQMAVNGQIVFTKYPLYYFVGSRIGPFFIGSKEHDHLHLF